MTTAFRPAPRPMRPPTRLFHATREGRTIVARCHLPGRHLTRDYAGQICHGRNHREECLFFQDDLLAKTEVQRVA